MAGWPVLARTPKQGAALDYGRCVTDLVFERQRARAERRAGAGAERTVCYAAMHGGE